MPYRVQFFSLLLALSISCISFGQEPDSLVRQLKSGYENIAKFRSGKDRLSKAWNQDFIEIRRDILKIQRQLQTISNHLDNPIYFKNDIMLDSNLDLVDLYLYEYSENYFQAFGRIKNKQRKYLEWVELRFNLYNNGIFVATDYTYIDFESYGYCGISPYKYSFINTFIDKADFDSIAFQIQYDTESGDDDILWDQILRLESVTIIPSGSYHKWQGLVRNDFNYTMRFPCIYACIMKQGRMVALDYTYLDVQNNQMPANSSGVFDSYIDLPDSYDDIKYYINYALYSLDGNGNLPPNAPIFVKDNYSGYSRINTNFEAFVIDPERDTINLKIDFGDGYTSTWYGNFLSGYNANIQYPYGQAGNFPVRAKASDGSLETQWSENVYASIALSSTPVISTSEIKDASYKKYYNFQLQSNGGIEPVSWQIKNGALPDGLSMDCNNGLIMGVPLRSGSFEFSVYCTDSGIPSVFDSATFQLRVNNQRPIITSPDSVTTFVNTAVQYIASGTDPDENPISFEFSNYPNWLSVTNSTLSGITPNRILDTSFTLIATDGDLSDTMDVIILVRTKPLSILSHDIQDGVYGNEYHDTLRASGGLAPYTWSVMDGNLPIGLDLNVSGVISGVPSSSGHFQFTAQVQDSDNPPQTDSRSFVLNVVNDPPQITSSDTVSTRRGEEFIYAASATDPNGNHLSYQFYNYPLWLSATDSTLTGNVPLMASDTSFSLVVSDGELRDSMKVVIIVYGPSSVSTPTFPIYLQLSENYPNPFNPTTRIKIDLPENTNLESFIYDINGNLVQELYNGQLSAGVHVLTWNANNSPSGIYFIRFKLNRFNKVIKCTLLK